MLPAQREGNDQNNGEQSPLLTAENVESVDGPAIEASPIRKLQCLVFSLVLIMIGFVAALNEGTASYQEMHKIRPNTSNWPWYKQDNPNLWVCLFIKCVQLSMAIGSIIYLQKRVMLPGRISKASFCDPSFPQLKYSLGNLRRFQELPADLANYPTKLFISIFIIFAILGTICAMAETIADLIDVLNPLEYHVVPYADVLRCTLLFIFITLQTIFFMRNNRLCLHWKLDSAWMAMSIILSTNLSLWFFYISHEVSEMASERHNCLINSTVQQELRAQLSMVAQIMFPFLIEFFLMSAILAGSFLSNAGRLGSILGQLQQSIRCLTTDAIRDKLFPQTAANLRPTNFAGHLHKHKRSLFFGLALVVTALVISVLMKLFVCEREPWHVLSTYILVVFFVSGSGCSVLLLCAFRAAGEASAEAKARTAADRLMLWCCVVAVVANDFNRFWGVFQRNLDLPNAIGTGLVTMFGICQSVLQVYVLECILLRRICSSDVLVGGSRNLGARLLTALMLINALEWLVSTVAFTLFFFDSSSSFQTATMALVVISAPLQVFFRFHSVGCIHEFKKHCREVPEDISAQMPPDIPIDFPTITPMYSSIV